MGNGIQSSVTSKYFQLLLAALIYFLLAKFGMQVIALKPSNITLLWMPAGVALIMCERWGKAALPMIFLASFSANFAGMSTTLLGNSLSHTAIAAAINAICPWLALIMMKRFVPDGLWAINGILRFAFFVCVIPMALSASLLMLNLLAGGYLDTKEWGLFVATITTSDTLGMLLVYPAYKAWLLEKRPQTVDYQRWVIELLVVSALIVIAFHFVHGLIYLIPLVMLHHLHRGTTQLMISSLLLYVPFILFMASDSLGPFASMSTEQGKFQVIAYLFSLASLVLAIGIANKALFEQLAQGDRLNYLANHDPLTGLANRRSFMAELNRAISFSKRSGKAFSLATIDIDDFKRINDTYGHNVGDEVLMWLGNRVKDSIRETDMIARTGGEEFALIFPMTDLTDAAPLLSKIARNIASSTIECATVNLSITISGGIVRYTPSESDHVDELLNSADLLLYKAKRNGKNQVLSS